jgi:hypothetical protein
VNRDAMQKLRLDRRLIQRRGWIAEGELERELAGLADVAGKATTLGQAADDREAMRESGASAERSKEPSTAQ